MRKNALILVFTMLAFIACKFKNDKKTLPIYGKRTTVTKNVNGQATIDTVYQTIPAFSFINQYGDSISNKSLAGKIYVADFFFTTCPSICPTMHRNMLDVYDAFKNAADFKIISQTIDPKHDSVPVLKKYADKLGVTGNCWWFVQGKKEDVYKLSESYLVTAPTPDAKQGYLHDGSFVLIDKLKRVRGAYDGTDPKQVSQMITDIKTLQAETAETTGK